MAARVKKPGKYPDWLFNPAQCFVAESRAGVKYCIWLCSGCGAPYHYRQEMDRLATAIMIALAALVMNGGMLRDVMAEEAGMRITALSPVTQKSQMPAATGLRSERVLSLLLTLEALRAAPALLDTSKV